MKRFLLFYLVLHCTIPSMLQAQGKHIPIIQAFLQEQATTQPWSKADVSQWIITHQHTSRVSDIHYVYIQQTHQGIPVTNGTATIAIKDGAIQSMGDRLLIHLHQRTPDGQPSITSAQAIGSAAKALGLPTPQKLVIQKELGSQAWLYNKAGISQTGIPVQLVYYETPKRNLHLAWDLSIHQLDGKHWWSVKIDAQTGQLLDQKDWVVSCSFDHSGQGTTSPHQHIQHPFPSAPDQVQQPDQYTVYPLPVESPNHGNRAVVTNPADPLASPYGWHDTNAVAGPEFTITHGNNVYVYEDTPNRNSPGYSPDGGTALEFNFPIPANSQPTDYLDASITNLFYMNNMMHDIWYHHGFDEASGNFQYNNYGRGGIGHDPVLAEAQDGGGTNNANMSTPPDGSTPRMQMYIWHTPAPHLTINSPNNIAGRYNAAISFFGPQLTSTPITGDLALIEDNTPPIHDGCEPLVNNNIMGRIAVIDAGNCPFFTQIKQAEQGGAIAAIIINNQPGPPFRMTAGFGNLNPISIPSIMISQVDGNTLKAAMLNGTVNASLDDAGGVGQTDSDLDNVIIAHEYAHGITNRLVGGALNANCLWNAEQMGEGWSDWFGLMLTMEPGDQASDPRGIATYSEGYPITGKGIRPAPYSTDFALNNYTYGHSNDLSISKPHGVGFIYATVLWDLNWALIHQYGGTPNPNWYGNTGGNIIAMKLVMESLKLLPCEPGMIDGRDAILRADSLLYNGAHRCLIWEVFARRGFGYGASQGSSQSRFDQIEAFDIPLNCETVVSAPIAAFGSTALNTCFKTILFRDSSTAVPQSWLWTFGDGATSTLRHPTHTYTQGGTYMVTLIVTNTMGADTITQSIFIRPTPPPTANDVSVCLGDTARLYANGSGTIQWLDNANNVIHIGNTLVVPDVQNRQTYYLENVVTPTAQFIGPASPTPGNTSIHNLHSYGALNFSTERPLDLVSAYVVSDSAGPRTFYLATGSSFDQEPPSASTIIDRVTVNLVTGGQRIDLNFHIPVPGNYNIGSADAPLFHDYKGATYPYTLPNYMTITSSSYSPHFSDVYYFFYNIEVRDPLCTSVTDSVQIFPVTSNFTFTSGNFTVNFTDASTGATSWLWHFGDGDSSMVQNPTHTYTTNGTYTVTLTINGSCVYSQTVTIRDIHVHQTTGDLPTLQLLPNPAKEQTTLVLNRAVDEDLMIHVHDVTGRYLFDRRLIQGETRLDLPVSTLPAGVYLVSIQGKSFHQTKKLMLE